MTKYFSELDDRCAAAQSLDDAAAVLEELLSRSYAVWGDGSLYRTKELVARINGLRIEVHSREHPPPHFHVTYDDHRSSFTVDDCKFLEGEIGGRERALVEWWHKRCRAQIVMAWNKSRPSDCPVGPIAE